MKASYLNYSEVVKENIEALEAKFDIEVYLMKSSKYKYQARVTRSGGVLAIAGAHTRLSLYSLIRAAAAL